MNIDLFKKIHNSRNNFLDIMSIENILSLKNLNLYIKYLILSNKKYIKNIYDIFEKYNIIQFFYKYYSDMNDIFEKYEKLFFNFNKKFQNLSKIIDYLIDNQESTLITINHFSEMSKFILLYSNKKKWIHDMCKLDKNTDIMDIFQIAIKGYIQCDIIYNYDNFFLKNIDENVIFVNTYL